MNELPVTIEVATFAGGAYLLDAKRTARVIAGPFEDEDAARGWYAERSDEEKETIAAALRADGEATLHLGP